MDSNYILAIESSCDDTAAAVINKRKKHSNIVSSQTNHKEYGGIVPELASRAHQKNIVLVVNQALTTANIAKKDLSAIAFTNGPGLMGSLMVGNSFAKSMALSLDIPLIEVDHLEAHILAHFIEDANEIQPNFPFLCLLVSGGHTQIVKVSDYFKMETIGETLDDAAGEAFDKIGKTLGLEYPAGPILDKKAQNGNPKKFKFTHPKVDGYNFSFSGLKTAVLYFIQKQEKIDPGFVKNNLDDLCASVQHTIVSILINNLKKASNDTGIRNIAIAGGVSANSELRKVVKSGNWNAFIPKFEYTTDNAAMIGLVGALKYEKKLFTSLETKPYARKPTS